MLLARYGLGSLFCGSRRVGGGGELGYYNNIIHVEDEARECNTMLLLKLTRFRRTPYFMKHGIIYP